MTLNSLLPFPPRSLLFAPLEGMTDGHYRQVAMRLYPEWARFSTDFLRIPTNGKYSRNKYLEHLGAAIHQNPALLEKTIFQIITTEKAQTSLALETLAELGISHLDLNIGCPSRTVINHGGGCYLLGNLSALKNVLATIRNHWSGLFTVKMRIGIHDDSLFDETLKIIEGSGVNAITVHARTRDQLYKGRADWRFIKRAVDVVKIPVIGNGDIWTVEDVNNCLNETGCHSVMIGRGALKTPWLPQVIGSNANFQIRCLHLPEYYQALSSHCLAEGDDATKVLNRLKSLSRYVFDDFAHCDLLKTQLMRSNSLNVFFEILEKAIVTSGERIQALQ